MLPILALITALAPFILQAFTALLSFITYIKAGKVHDLVTQQVANSLKNNAQKV
jgi:hypothetical protein